MGKLLCVLLVTVLAAACVEILSLTEQKKDHVTYWKKVSHSLMCC